MKNYFKTYFKSFGVFTTILFALIVAGLVCASGLSKILVNSASIRMIFEQAVRGVGYCYVIAIALLGIGGITSKKVKFMDLLRITTFIGSLLGFIALLVAKKATTFDITIYLSECAVLLIELIVRVFSVKEDDTDSISYKNFYAAVAKTYNPIILLVISAVVSLGLYFVLANYESMIQQYQLIILAVFGVIAILGILLPVLDIETEATPLDAICVVLLFGTAYLALFGFTALSKISLRLVIAAAGLSAVELVVRALTYRKPLKGEPKLKLTKYFKGVYKTKDCLPWLLLAAVVLGLFAVAAYIGIGNNSVATKLARFVPAVLATVLGYVSAVGTLAVIVLVFVFRKFKSEKVEKVDGLLITLFTAGVFAVPYIVVVAKDLGFSVLTSNIDVLVALAMLVVALIVGCVILPMRVKNYVPVPEEEEAPAEEAKEEAPAVVEEAAEEEVEEEEVAEEEVAEEEVAEEEVAEEEAAEEEATEDEFEDLSDDEFVEEEPVVEEETSEDDDEFAAFIDGLEEGEETPAEEEEPAQDTTEEDDEFAAFINEMEEGEGNGVPQPAQSEEDDDEFSKMSDEELNALLAENGVLEEDEALLGEDEDEEEEEEELSEEEAAEEAEEEPAQPENQAKEAGILVPEVSIVDEEGNVKKIKRKFNTKMMFASYETKEYYNEIKNYLLQYRAKGRFSARCETFRYKGLIAKVALAGKSIKVCLALDPAFVAQTPKYHFKDVSAKKQYAEVPVMIKVRSDRGLKYFKELVDIMMAQRGVKAKRNFEATNYIPQLIPNGEAILGSLGLSTDYLYNMMNVRSIPQDLPDDLINYLPVIPGEPIEGEEVEASIFLDTLCTHFNDGDEVTLEKLQEMHVINKGNTLRIKARGTLDKKLIIYAENFEADALKMLMCTNCTAVRIVRDFE